jgi:hypothetical protein
MIQCYYGCSDGQELVQRQARIKCSQPAIIRGYRDYLQLTQSALKQLFDMALCAVAINR